MRLLLIIIPLLLILVGSLWFASMAWTALGGEPMPAYGYYAMGGGIAFSLLIGCGLMALVFYSNRRGYDDAAASDMTNNPSDTDRR